MQQWRSRVAALRERLERGARALLAPRSPWRVAEIAWGRRGRPDARGRAVSAALGAHLPDLLGGSGDLAGSILTLWSGAKGVSAASAEGNYVYYGVREFAMAAIMNGLALHGGFIPYGATFLIFMEYARNAVRMSALMGQRVLYVFTHDSIGLGEDGPTHQPVEQLTALRATPNLQTWRPADAVESAIAWKHALLRDNGPTAMIFSRQTLAHQKTSKTKCLLRN